MILNTPIDPVVVDILLNDRASLFEGLGLLTKDGVSDTDRFIFLTKECHEYGVAIMGRADVQEFLTSNGVPLVDARVFARTPVSPGKVAVGFISLPIVLVEAMDQTIFGTAP